MGFGGFITSALPALTGVFRGQNERARMGEARDARQREEAFRRERFDFERQQALEESQRAVAQQALADEFMRANTANVQSQTEIRRRPPAPEEPKAGDFALIPGEKGVLQRVRKAGPEGIVSGVTTRVPVNANPQASEMRSEAGLRKEYTNVVKDYDEIARAYRKVEEAGRNPSAAGDLSLIFGYMKLLDPGSTVREGEFANAQNSAGVPDQVRNAYNRAMSGERLNPRQRQDFINQAGGVIRSQRQALKATQDRYRGIAQEYGIDPSRVIYDPFMGVVDAPPVVPSRTGKPGTEEDTDAIIDALMAEHPEWTDEQIRDEMERSE